MRDHLFASAGRSGRPGDPAQPVRAGSRQDSVRPLPGRDQRPDDPRKRQRAHRGPYPAARHPPVPHRAARLPASQEVRVQPDRRRSAMPAGLELAFAAFLERRAGRAGLRQELHGRGLQARLRAGPTATFRTTRRISSSAPRTARSGSSRPRAARNSTCRRRWRGCGSGAPTPPRPARREGGPRYGFVYVDQEGFEQHKPASFAGLAERFPRIPGGLRWHAKTRNPTN